MNAHDAIIDAVLATLRAEPPVTDGPIAEDIDAGTIPEDATECISVSLDTSDPDRISLTGYPVNWTTDIVIECYARADGRRDGALTAGRASRALHQRVHARLMADPGLGGRAMDLRPPRIRSDRDQADTRLGCCIATYSALHRTAAASLEAA